MPSQSSAITTAARFPLPYMVERGTYASLTLDLKQVVAGAATSTASPTVPTGSIFKVYDPAGNVVLSETVSSPETATHTFEVLAAWAFGAGYVVEWSYSTNIGGGRSEGMAFRNELIVCRRVLYCPISDNDVYAVCTALNPNAAKPIHSLTSLNVYVNQAWTRVERRLIENGNRPNLIMSPSALHDVTVLLSLALAFEDFTTRLNPAYMEQSRMYREQYEQAWSRLSFQYAADDGTTAAPNRRKSATSSVFLGTTRRTGSY